MRLIPWFLLVVCTGVLPAQDEAADAYNFAAGLHDRGLFSRAVPAFRKYLKAWPRDRRARKARFYLGQSLVECGQDQEAASCFESCLGSPKDELRSRALLRAAEIRLRLDDAKLARKHAATLLGDRPPPEFSTPALYYLGEACCALGDAAAGRKAYLRLLASTPRDRLAPYAQSALGFLDFEEEHFDSALGHFQSAATLEGGDEELRSEAQVMVGECLLASRQGKRAELAFQKALSAGCGRFETQARMGVAQALLDQKRASAAVEAYRDLVRRFPNDPRIPRALIRGAAGLQELGRNAEGLSLLGLVSNAKGQDAVDLAYWSGRLLEAGGNRKAAIAKMRRAATTPKRRFSLADTLSRAGQHREAAQIFGKVAAEAKDPELRKEALFAEAFARHRLGQHERALKILVPLGREKNPPSFQRDLRFAIAENLFLLSRYEEAARWYGQIAGKGPGHYANEAMHKLAWCRYRLKNYPKALESFSLFLRTNPPSEVAEETRYLMARCHEALGQHDRAGSLFERVASGHGKMETQALLGRAASLRRKGRNQDAISVLRQAVAKSTDGPLRLEAEIALGDTYLEEKSFREASQSYEKLLRSNPKAPLSCRLKLAWALRGLGDQEGAAREAATVAARDQSPDVGGEALYLVGLAQSSANKRELSAAALTRFLQTWPSHPRATAAKTLLGITRARLGQAAAAVKLLSELANRTPRVEDHDVILYELAFCYGKLAKPQLEESCFARLQSEHPRSPLAGDAAFRRAEAAYAAKRWGPALTLYSFVLRHPEAARLGAQARYKSGWCYRNQGQHKKAAAHFAAVARGQSPLSAESCYLAAEELESGKELRSALPFWDAMVKSHKDHELWGDASCRRVLCLARLGDHPRVISLAPGVLQRFGKEKRATALRSALGDALFALERWERARTAYRTVIRASEGPLAARAQYRVGRCFEKEGNSQRAIDEYLRVTILYAHAEWVAKASHGAALLLEAAGESDKALRLWQELARDHGKLPEGKDAQKRIEARARKQKR